MKKREIVILQIILKSLNHLSSGEYREWFGARGIQI